MFNTSVDETCEIVEEKNKTVRGKFFQSFNVVLQRTHIFLVKGLCFSDVDAFYDSQF